MTWDYVADDATEIYVVKNWYKLHLQVPIFPTF